VLLARMPAPLKPVRRAYSMFICDEPAYAYPHNSGAWGIYQRRLHVACSVSVCKCRSLASRRSAPRRARMRS
jgi:hypothetical protein